MTGAPRRFVHVFATFGAGGPQVRAVQLMQHLGSDCRHVVMAMDGCTDAAAMVPAGVAVELAAPPPRAGLLSTVRAQRRWLAAQRPALVLTYNWGAIETTIAARWSRLPLVHHEDGFLPEEAVRRLRRRSWLRAVALRPVPVVVPSAVLQRIAVREWHLREGGVHLLPNGVDLQRFRAAPRADTAPLVVGTVGGLRPEKDHATLLRAFAQVGGDVRLRIVGGGALGAALQQQAVDLGIGPRVDFVGAVTDTAPEYARCDVFVLSSRTEQMPMALLEAMACALPVVATDVGDVRVILPPPAQGWVVAPGDAAALAAALRTQLADGALRRTLGAANRRRAEERYDARTCLDRFAAVYRAALRP